MATDEAWELLLKAMEATRPGCMVVLSPRIVISLLAQHVLDQEPQSRTEA
jgi:hypothetical protein